MKSSVNNEKFFHPSSDLSTAVSFRSQVQARATEAARIGGLKIRAGERRGWKEKEDGDIQEEGERGEDIRVEEGIGGDKI